MVRQGSPQVCWKLDHGLALCARSQLDSSVLCCAVLPGPGPVKSTLSYSEGSVTLFLFTPIVRN